MLKVFLTGGHGTTAPSQQLELTEAELRAVVEAAHSPGARVRAHVACKAGILLALECGVDVLDHCDGMDDECIDAIVAAGAFVVPSIFFPKALLELMVVRASGSPMRSR